VNRAKPQSVAGRDWSTDLSELATGISDGATEHEVELTGRWLEAKYRDSKSGPGDVIFELSLQYIDLIRRQTS
jgi:hypothetical protein